MVRDPSIVSGTCGHREALATPPCGQLTRGLNRVGLCVEYVRIEREVDELALCRVGWRGALAPQNSFISPPSALQRQVCGVCAWPLC